MGWGVGLSWLYLCGEGWGRVELVVLVWGRGGVGLSWLYWCGVGWGLG